MALEIKQKLIVKENQNGLELSVWMLGMDGKRYVRVPMLDMADMRGKTEEDVNRVAEKYEIAKEEIIWLFCW